MCHYLLTDNLTIMYYAIKTRSQASSPPLNSNAGGFESIIIEIFVLIQEVTYHASLQQVVNLYGSVGNHFLIWHSVKWPC